MISKMKLLILYLYITTIVNASIFDPPSLFKPSPFTQDNVRGGSFITHKYIPPQNIGAGMISPGIFIKVQNQYVPPQNIGGGRISQGGIAQVIIPPPSPVIQTIIDIATMTARGQKSNE